MIDYKCKLEEGKFYHIYNRGNNSDTIFYNNGNYEYFLKKYDEYLSDYLETYSFCLLPNHFHLLVRVKDQNPARVLNSGRVIMPKDISLKFSHFFNSYSQSINKQQSRHGSLFEKPYRRIEVNSMQYLQNLVFYIHANPQLHGFTDDFRTYKWSSYQRILNDKPSKLFKKEVIEWFNDKKNFINFHLQKIESETIKHLLLE